MSSVRVLVGTRKGGFILASDGTRDRWSVSGPHFGGWEIYHMKGSPPIRTASTRRSRADGSGAGHSALERRRPVVGARQINSPTKAFQNRTSGDGTPHPWEFKRVWHLEPSLDDPDVIYAGVEDAALFRSTDGART